MNYFFKFYTVNLDFCCTGHVYHFDQVQSAIVWLVTWILTGEPRTADCRYNAVQYNRIFHTAFAFHVIRKICRIKFEWQFSHIWTQCKPSIGRIRACRRISIKTIDLLGHLISPTHSMHGGAPLTLKYDIYWFNRLRNLCYQYTTFR